MSIKSIHELRSQRWYASDDIRGFAHRQRTQQMGLRRAEFLDKPVVAILNTWSDMSPCHAHLRDRAEAVKRGVWQAGGFPVELPALSVGEVFVKPSTMLYRNFLAMEAEELLRSHPIDGAVLLGGCDKSTPALIMGAISMGLPFIFCPAGPMSNGQWRGQITGAGTHTKRYWADLQAGQISADDWVYLERCMTRTTGTCNTMGTASTMTSLAEAMGLTLPGASSIPAVDSGHSRMAAECGCRIVQMIWNDLTPSKLLSRSNFINAAIVYAALGGSTNAAIHLIAMARRCGIHLTLDGIGEIAKQVPVIANIFPTGRYLMEDFYFAGGLPALLRKISTKLSLDAYCVNGASLGDNIANAKCWNDDVIRPLSKPVVPMDTGCTLAVLHGNLAPHGAVIKTSAASRNLLRHTGKAIVFESPADLKAQIDILDIEASDILVLRNSGPVGAPGMPEWGNLPIPKKLLSAGVCDMVRISDGRMSGTHYGTCILHVAPEAAVGGPLSLLCTGDQISVDIPHGKLDMLVDERELATRRAKWTPSSTYERSYAALYQAHVNQAPDGCDFDFLAKISKTPEPDIF